MIAFGTAVSDDAMYRGVALPGIERVAEADSPVLTRHGYDSIQRPYNEMIEEAAGLPGLEALVLLHQDLELTDGSLMKRLRSLLAEPRIGLVGLFGGRDILLHQWFGGSVYGHSTVPDSDTRHSHGSHEVEVVDGALLALPASTVRALRFDETQAEHFHGYDVEFSLRVRAAGQRVVCDDIPYIHHMSRPWADRSQFVGAGVALRRRWDPELRPREWAPAFQR